MQLPEKFPGICHYSILGMRKILMGDAEISDPGLALGLSRGPLCVSSLQPPYLPPKFPLAHALGFTDERVTFLRPQIKEAIRKWLFGNVPGLQHDKILPSNYRNHDLTKPKMNCKHDLCQSRYLPITAPPPGLLQNHPHLQLLLAARAEVGPPTPSRPRRSTQSSPASTSNLTPLTPRRTRTFTTLGTTPRRNRAHTRFGPPIPDTQENRSGSAGSTTRSDAFKNAMEPTTAVNAGPAIIDTPPVK
ncbi:hypothetical protein B0H14DRAFT_2650040 [Mycena olivaceomarginata]|nr:hypothetical protein B0H14DRAFT_2650040 [Mycena olivaceomarginata]